ncbi:hypothetical protein ET33_14040 [Paenibacillus tyrfis]|uniref:Uncharacterized protein n=1 Tax=Paenibacillus tyrfis TaxID=1501230 RepID=A0A081PAR4_9BACL|nr:hypothetical protein ET33_14040 [Paenibacillus tyrfis]
MNPIARRKIRQHMQSCSDKTFWDNMNFIHNQAYQLAIKHVHEAMECMPGITKKQVEAVMQKTVEIRENWDGLHEIEVEASIDRIITGQH